MRQDVHMSPAPFGPDALHALVDALRSRIETVVVGKPEAVGTAVATFLAGGHLLIEDVPGVGKTTLALSLARCLDLTSSRIQFTADLMPTDVTGLSVYDQATREFRFHPGPVFAGIVVADEINRATPRTQSALLEAMGEGRVSVEGRTLDLPDPRELLDDPAAPLPRRPDHLHALLGAVVAHVIADGSAPAWERAWTLIARVARTTPDVAAARERRPRYFSS